MCPPRHGLGVPERQELPYQRWLNTATCCRANLFLHRVNNHFLCVECYADKSPYERSFYDFSTRHYIHIGTPAIFEECRHCSVIIPRMGTIQSCEICPVVLNDFIEYLAYTRETPYASHEPTILAIEHLRTSPHHTNHP